MSTEFFAPFNPRERKIVAGRDANNKSILVNAFYAVTHRLGDKVPSRTELRLARKQASREKTQRDD